MSETVVYESGSAHITAEPAHDRVRFYVRCYPSEIAFDGFVERRRWQFWKQDVRSAFGAATRYCDVLARKARVRADGLREAQAALTAIERHTEALHVVNDMLEVAR